MPMINEILYIFGLLTISLLFFFDCKLRKRDKNSHIAVPRQPDNHVIDDHPDDLMCLMIKGGNTITTQGNVTVLGTKK